MPEGPECTIVATQVKEKIKGKTLTRVELLSGRYTKNPPVGYKEFPIPARVESVENKGKFIYWILDKGYIFCTLGMTGTYKSEENKYSRVKFTFEDSSTLFYSDMRNFGTLKFISGDKSKQELNKKLSEIGPDMLNNPCDEQTWVKICEKKKTNSLVKFLMEQKNISGIGNIYKSESLFLSKLAPHRKIKDCSREELLTLYSSVKTVLSNAHSLGGATIRNYSDLYSNQGSYITFPSKPDEMMKARIGVMVYSKKEDPFGNKIEKIRLDDGRTTYWSPTIQK